MGTDMGYVAQANINYKDPVTVGWGQQIQDNITALVNLLANYKTDVRAIYNNASTVTISTGSIMINSKLRKNTANITLGWANTGGNDIAETSSTGYYIWAVASGASSTFECAINQTSSNMTGNANARLIGWFWNDTAKNIEGVWYLDPNNRKCYESCLYPIVENSSYVFNHNLQTKNLNLTFWLTTGNVLTNLHYPLASVYGNDAATQLQYLNDSTFTIHTESAACCNIISGSIPYPTAVSVKIFLQER